jgi:radical SAM superfamily enzyme YgiQ (UPF0313 family)
MKRNIVLINPWIYDFSAYDFWYRPLGLLSLASLLRMNGTHISWIDCLDSDHPEMHHEPNVRMPKRGSSGEGAYASERLPTPGALSKVPRYFKRYGVTPRIFLKTLGSIHDPDMIMISSMMTYWYPGVFDIISYVKKTFPGVPVVLGGNYVTLCPGHASSSGADFCLPGPAESSVPSLLKNLFNMDMTFLPDLRDLDSYPYPSFDLIRNLDCVPIMTSRGCPYHCSYCASRILNNHFLRRNPFRVADEIEYWHSRFGIRNFSFYDDALLVNSPEMAVPLFREIIRRGLSAQFHCPNGLHLREITPELSSLMHRAGVRNLRFGFETSDSIRQIKTGGKISNDEFKEAIRYLRFAGYRTQDIGIYILCGLPGQPADEIRESIQFVRSLGTRPLLAEYSPIPGSDLWSDAISCSSYPIETEPLFHNNTLLPCKSASLTNEMYQSLKLMARLPGHSEDS